MRVLLVMLGASVGAPARMLVGRALPGPRGTFVVNLLGSFLVGLFAGLPPRSYALLATGLCGAFTTYSAFAVDARKLTGRRAAAYVVGSVVACLGACAVGLQLT